MGSVAYLLTSGKSLTYNHGNDNDFWEEMMKRTYLASAAALLASTSMTLAGGIERTSQSVDIIFEEGSVMEFSLSYAVPSVSGLDPFAWETGVMSPSYFSFAGGYKTDLNDKIGLAIIFDQPFGSLAEYTAGLYVGLEADLASSAITVIGSYDITDRIVAFGGVSYQTMSATATIPSFFGLPYIVDAAPASGFGYVLGAAYQIPDIALRVALTYRSEITANHDTVEFGVLDSGSDITTVTTPQSVNLEFQTGINEKILVFGSVRWVNWSAFDLSPPDYEASTGGALIAYADDRITYNLGVGRKLSDTLSAAIAIGYEENLGGNPSPLAPTDGFFSVGAGLTYTMGNTKITGGAKYIWLGDSVGPAGTFENNTALGFGLGVSIAM